MRKNSFLWSRRFTTGPSVHLSGKVLIAAALLCLGTATELDAQKRTKVTIRTERTNFKKVIREIEKQTDYDVFYNSKQLPTEDFAFRADGKDVKDVLGTLCAKYGLEYSIQDNTITLRPRQAGRSSQQRREIKGHVIDEVGLPLPGVSVTVKGKERKGTSTDMDGNFKLTFDADEKPTLQFSMVGMESQSVTVRKKDELNIVMRESTNTLNEVVKIGYATSSRKDLTGSISSLDTRIIESSAASTITQMIQGQLPGVSVTLGDGSPGATSKIEIRGASTLDGNSSPLIVVDDVPMSEDYDINMLNPYDVQQLDVLKGASATAIYGSRAAGGVIMITTKGGGRNKKPIINYGYSFKRSQLVSKIRTLSTDEFKLLLLEAARNEALAQGYDNISESSDYQRYTSPGFFGEENTNWMNELMQDANSQQHNVSIQGASTNSSYNGSFSYADDQGMIKSLYNKRYTFSAGFNTDINKKLRAIVGVNGSFARKNENQRGMDVAIEGRPDSKVYNEDGTYYHQTYNYGGTTNMARNPLAEILGTKNLQNSNNLTLSTSLEWRPINGLTLTGRYSYQTYNYDTDYYASSDTYEGSDNFRYTFQGYGRRTHYKSNEQEVEARANYSTVIKRDHSLTAMLAATFNDASSENYWIAMDNFGDDNVQNGIWQGTELYERNPTYGSSLGSVMLSFLGRMEYKFRNRYILTANIRTDGSSKFSPQTPLGHFPGFCRCMDCQRRKVRQRKPSLAQFLQAERRLGKSGQRLGDGIRLAHDV